MLTKLINLAIVDDHTLFRKTLRNYISEHKNANVVIQSPNIPDLLQKLKDYHVHILLLDLYLPGISGFDAVKIIKSEYPDIKILVISMCSDLSLLSDIVDAGVYGIISKADEPEEVMRAIVSVAEQRIYRSKLLTEVMYWDKQYHAKKNVSKSHLPVSEREREILQLLWEEKSNKEIASSLFLSVRSVEKIRQEMKEKLGVKSTVGLFKYAINEKIIKISAPWANNLQQVEQPVFSR
jgi:DNA-binding NarL/FixJ family response regulator